MYRGAIQQLLFANAQKHSSLCRESVRNYDEIDTHLATLKAVSLTCDPDAAYRRQITCKGRLVFLILSISFVWSPRRFAAAVLEVTWFLNHIH
jgi:hypothetical protein